MDLINSGSATESKRGGKRAGAGRRPKDYQKWMTVRGITPATASDILANADERRKWHRIMNSEDDRVVLSALMFLMQMRDGKPAQAINVTSTSISLNARDIEAARAIVREIRGESPTPRLGTSGAEGSSSEAIAQSASSADDTSGGSIGAVTIDGGSIDE